MLPLISRMIFSHALENLPNIFNSLGAGSIALVRGCIHAALAKFCVAFSKATVLPYPCRGLEWRVDNLGVVD